MSDLCFYELDDNVWDEFGESGDHIVPHPDDEQGDQHAVLGDSCKKSRREVINETSKYDTREEERTSPTPTKGTMLEKGPWFQTPNGVLPASCDSNETTSIASDNTKVSSHYLKSDNPDSVGSGFCAYDSLSRDKCAARESNLYHCPINDISQDNAVSYLDNDNEDKEGNDLLYYGWPDIGNFEDVDRMFRSCDETFGLGSLNNEDELPWFTSSNATETSEDALKSGFNFLCSELSGLKTVSENHETSRPKNAGPSLDVCDEKNISITGKVRCQTTESDDPAALCDLSYVDGSSTRSQNKNDSSSKEQMNLSKKQSKHKNQSEGKRKVQHLEIGGSFYCYGNPENVNQPFRGSFCHIYSPSGNGHRSQNVGSDTLCYTQTHIPYVNMAYGHPSDQTSVHSTLSIAQSEDNGGLSPTPKESSYASNQLQLMDISHVLTFEVPAVTTNVKKEKLSASFSTSFKHADAASPMTFCDPLPVPKQMHLSENELDGKTEVEGVTIRIPAELASSNAQEISCTSSVLDEVSLESSSFCQLQKVMQQLDTRTKLCIRDSLYRLARSAEQRHYCANTNGGMGDDRDPSGAIVAEEKNKCGYLDIETDTNPIDRSIAHLLFHRPSDPSIMTTNDPSPLKPHAMVRESVTSQLAKTEKQICNEDTSSTTKNKKRTVASSAKLL